VSDSKNEVCYTGGIYDESTGLYYLNARYYDPEKGRFLTQDTYRGEQTEPSTWHLYVYCANNPINYVDPSGHAAIVLKSNFATRWIGHMAVLVQDSDGTWKYFSWDKDGYKAKYMGKKVNTDRYKGVKNGKVYSDINKRFKRKVSKYKKYIKIDGDFIPSYDYIKEVKNGESFTRYNLTGRNCAWMAIHVLRKSYSSEDAIYQKLRKMLYDDKAKVKTIIPNSALKTLSDYFNADIKKVKKSKKAK